MLNKTEMCTIVSFYMHKSVFTQIFGIANTTTIKRKHEVPIKFNGLN